MKERMSEPTILVAECGCRYKVVARRPEGSDTGMLKLGTICVPHSQERTKHLKRREEARGAADSR